jgi:hypothetical protein
LRLHDKNWSEGVAKLAVKYSAKMSYGDATEALHELGQMEISESSVWRLTQAWGEALKQVEEKEAERANSVAEEATPGNKIEKDGRLGISMDGCMIYIRGDEWKELKVGCVFEVDWTTIFDPQTKDKVEVGHALSTSYVSHLGGPESFGRKLWTETRRRKWHSAIDTQVVADGATWIWNLVGDYWYDAHQLVDWYHATEHLGLAAALAFGQGTTQAQRWFKQYETLLYQGHADQIARAISNLAEQMPAQRQELLQHAGYFENQQHRMNYLEMRADGWVIGSGMVESGGKRFKDRFTKAGMRWTRSGAERLLPLRTAVMSRRFDERWNAAYNSPPN